MKYVEMSGGPNSPSILSDTKAKEAINDAVKDARSCVQASEKLFSSLKCPHIDNAIRRLANSLDRPISWPELNTLSRALRDSIEVELREYLYFQYPKHK